MYEDNIKNVTTEEELQQLENIVDESINWLDDNDNLTKEELENKRKEIDDIYVPIITKSYQKNNMTTEHQNNNFDEIPHMDGKSFENSQ